jgi:hypothetical protein
MEAVMQAVTSPETGERKRVEVTARHRLVKNPGFLPSPRCSLVSACDAVDGSHPTA